MTDIHHVYAFYLPAVEEIRKPSIQMKINELEQDKASAVKTEADPMSAIAAAIQTRQRGAEHVSIIGALRDLVPPEEQAIEDRLWHQSILHVMQDAGITFIPLDAAKRKITMLKGENETVVRSYHHARLVLRDELERRVSTKVIGRPPYGYQVVHGNLKLNKDYIPAIRFVIQGIRDGWPLVKILSLAKKQYPNEMRLTKGGTKRKSKQFWGHQKIKRIHDRIRLYTLGEYTGSDGKTYIDRNLAFLPPEWADVKWAGEINHPPKDAS